MIIPCNLRTNMLLSRLWFDDARKYWVLRVPFSPCLSNADMIAYIGTPHYHHHQGWFLKSLISFTNLSCVCISKTKGISLHHRIFKLQRLLGTEELNSTLSRIIQTIHNTKSALQFYSLGILFQSIHSTFYSFGLGTF